MRNVFLTITFLLLISCGNSSEETEVLNKKIDSLQMEMESLKQANDTLSDNLLKKSYVTHNYPEYFDSIPDPEAFILEKLQNSRNLIPKEGVLGGTMYFTKVIFINENILLAEYEDGHVMGKGIFTYKMNKSGNLKFEFLEVLE